MSINYTALATGALGFTIALAWNNAVSKTMQSFFPPHSPHAAAWHTIIYAIIITLLVILSVFIFNHVHQAIRGETPTTGDSTSNPLIHF
jgi:heme/copper-type cytochrome/quinol oxidase subunit 2